MSRFRLLALNGVLLATVLACYLGRSSEGAGTRVGDFFHGVGPAYAGWKSTDMTLSPTELDMLQPDSVIARRFENGSEGVELIVVAGHKKRTVHTPGYCMPGDGWEVLTQVPHRMKVAGRPVPAMRSLMVKDRDRLLVTYFFTDGAYSTNNLLRFQGHQLVKRVRRVLPIGALVRMTVPVSTTPEAAGRLTDDFAARALPGVLQRLEQAHASI